jgi:predicted anti-sigma-YlaC factor YlaD
MNMLKVRHVTKFYSDWLDGRLSDSKQKKVQNHLSSCPQCRSYFLKMSDILTSPVTSELLMLEPDPYLPTRVRALSEEASGKSTYPLFRKLKTSVLSLLVVFALGLGIFMGSYFFRTPPSESDTRITQAYYEAFSSVNVVDRFEDFIESQEVTP